MMPIGKFMPVETPLGIIKGRDGIYLESIRFTDIARTLMLDVSLNTYLAEDTRDGEVDFSECTIVFEGVMATRIVELDSWDWSGESSFDEVLDSPMVAELGGKVTTEDRHFRVQTYDDVIDVVCASYRFKNGTPNKTTDQGT